LTAPSRLLIRDAVAAALRNCGNALSRELDLADSIN
jgi:hypothetical protein